MRKLLATILLFVFSALAVAGFQSAFASEYRIAGDRFDVVFDNDSSFGLFGTPTLADNTLFFTPVQFTSVSTSPQFDIAKSSVAFWIIANDNHHLTGTSLIERGSYSAFGDTAFASVAGQSSVVDIRSPKISTTTTVSGAFNLGKTQMGELMDWETTAFQTFAPDATKLRYSISNILFSKGGSDNGYSIVDKNYVGITVSAVDEPNQLLMALAGLGMLGFMARRRME